MYHHTRKILQVLAPLLLLVSQAAGQAGAWRSQAAIQAGPTGLATAGLSRTEVAPLEEYWQLVLAAQDLVSELEGMPPDAASAALQRMAERWEAVEAVQLADGSVMPIDHSHILAQMRADPPDLPHLSALLDSLLAARDAWPEGKFAADDLEALHKVLARPEFNWQPAEPSMLEIWWQKFLRSLASLLDKIFANEALGFGFSMLRLALPVLGIVVIAFVLVYALRGLRLSIASEAALDTEDDGVEENLSAEMALRRAQEMTSSGDYRQAVRYLYLSSLLLLEEHGLLRYDRSKTNREYLRSVAHLPELSTNLREVVEVFDRVWYGYQPLDQAAFERYAAHVTRLRELR